MQQYNSELLFLEEYPHLLVDGMRQALTLYLAPGAIPVETEVQVFDFLDLVGNVGGFLGLLLGASILTIMDGLKEATEKYLTKLKSST